MARRAYIFKSCVTTEHVECSNFKRIIKRHYIMFFVASSVSLSAPFFFVCLAPILYLPPSLPLPLPRRVVFSRSEGVTYGEKESLEYKCPFLQSGKRQQFYGNQRILLAKRSNRFLLFVSRVYSLNVCLWRHSVESLFSLRGRMIRMTCTLQPKTTAGRK